VSHSLAFCKSCALLVATFAVGCSSTQSWKQHNVYSLTDDDITKARTALCVAATKDHAEGADFLQDAMGPHATYKEKIAMGVALDQYHGREWTESNCVPEGRIADLMHQHPAENGS
jgi:hypothetical protein